MTMTLDGTSGITYPGGGTQNTGVSAPATVAQGGTGLSSPGTSGNVLTSNGTAWVSQAITALPGLLAQLYTTAGSYTFTIPSGVTALKVTVIGGGGGGGNPGTAGGNSTIASGTQTITTVTGGGGPGGITGYCGGGTATNGDINLTGGTGTRCFSDNGTPITGSGGAAGGGDGFSLQAANVGAYGLGGGGAWGRGGSMANSPTGFGSGGLYLSTAGGGGGGGGVAIKWLTGVTPGNTIAVTVGAGGTNATAGAVIFEW